MRLAGTQIRLGTAGLVATRWLPVLVYVAIIFALSAQPHLHPPLHYQNADKLFHFGEYGGLGFLLVRALRPTFAARPLVFASLLAVAIGMLVAASDERFQAYVPGRECDPFDWQADSLGIVAAQILFVATRRDEEL